MRYTPEAHAHEVHAYEAHAYEMLHAYEIHALNTCLSDIRTPVRYIPVRCIPMKCIPMTCTPIRYTSIICAPVRYRDTPMREGPVRYTPMRHPPNRYTLVGCIPVRYVLIFENGFVVLDAEPGLAGVSGLASAILCESGNSNFHLPAGTKLLDGVLASIMTVQTCPTCLALWDRLNAEAWRLIRDPFNFYISAAYTCS
jgi:hypothetical protein